MVANQETGGDWIMADNDEGTLRIRRRPREL
jgi:hypothetical protein